MESRIEMSQNELHAERCGDIQKCPIPRLKTREDVASHDAEEMAGGGKQPFLNQVCAR